jgi:hypothetical protein
MFRIFRYIGLVICGLLFIGASYATWTVDSPKTSAMPNKFQQYRQKMRSNHIQKNQKQAVQHQQPMGSHKQQQHNLHTKAPINEAKSVKN